MSKGWTEERRRAAAARIRQNKPWEKSIGPRTAAGKARSSMNALKHGHRCRIWDECREILWLNRIFILKVKKSGLLTDQHFHRANKLIAEAEKPSYFNSDRGEGVLNSTNEVIEQ